MLSGLTSANYSTSEASESGSAVKQAFMPVFYSVLEGQLNNQEVFHANDNTNKKKRVQNVKVDLLA